MSEAVFVTDAASSSLQSSRDRPESGFYCSTSGANITNRDDLAEHYKSDFHRYNLKRKVAGLPPVTKEWFEARRAQLVSSQTLAAQAVAPGHTQVWFDPLMRKTFRTEQTYLAHTRSNKYQEAVRQSGQPAPPAIISVRKVAEPNEQESVDVNKAAPRAGQVQATPGFMVVLPSGGLPLKTEDGDHTAPAPREEEEEDDGWETASDEDMAEAQEEGQEMPEWNVCRSLFDNHISRSFEENLERMWKLYGFYLPDAQYLTDPEGLVKYLGAKLQVGRVPLYTRGDDPNAKQFRSLHAVQRHMVDSGRCKMIYEDNEEEYEEFYDYDDEVEEEDTAGKELIVGGTAPAPAAVVAGELVVPGAGGSGAGKVLGSRDYARYYRQKHRTKDERLSVTVNVIQAKYRALGISLRDEAVDIETKKLKSKNTNDQKWEGKKNNLLFMRGNINRNLPKNVPY